jgi:hypothetical protein
MKKIILFTAALFIFSKVFANPQAPTQFNSYDGIIPGARALGMGFAFTSVCDDASSVYFNPAGLNGVSGNQVDISYEIARQSDLTASDLFSPDSVQGRNLVLLSLLSSKVAFTYRPLSSKSYYVQNDQDWTNTEIDINQYTVSVSTKKNNLTTGFNLSYLAGRIGQASVIGGVPSAVIADGNGASCDLGFLYTALPFRLGVNFQNLLGFMWWDTYQADQLPLFFRVGGELQLTNLLIFSGEWEKRYYRDGAPSQELTHFGLEQSLGNSLKIELGIYGEDLSDENSAHYTGGISYLMNGYVVSLAGELYRLEDTGVTRFLLSLNLPL